MPPQPDLSARLRKLKGARPELTWREIASRLGVSERGLMQWTRGGGISYANAQALADLFEVGLETFWITDKPAASQLDRIEAKLDELLSLARSATPIEVEGVAPRPDRDSDPRSRGSARTPAAPQTRHQAG